jgi:hypothetical protein
MTAKRPKTSAELFNQSVSSQSMEYYEAPAREDLNLNPRRCLKALERRFVEQIAPD